MSRRDHFPAVVLDIRVLVQQRDYIRSLLRRSGVHESDLEDLCQEIIIGAHYAMQRERFRPNPSLELPSVLRLWLWGIIWRQAKHYHERAHRRLEIPSGQAEFAEFTEALPVELESYVDVRNALGALAELPPWAQELLRLVAQGFWLTEIALMQGIPVGTVQGRLRRLLKLSTQAIERKRRRRRR
jgi:RNA polymerase sigma-70 factor, ECF subfamily